MKMKLARILLIPLAAVAAMTAVAAPAAHASAGAAVLAEAPGQGDWQGQQPGGQNGWQGNDGLIEELIEVVVGDQCDCGLLGLLLGCP